MCSVKSPFRQKSLHNFSVIAIALTVSGAVGLLPTLVFGEDQKHPLINSETSIQDQYKSLLTEQRVSFSSDRAVELIASGSAATLVGIYGYYFEDRGNLAKLAYAGTQTAGVFMVGEGIKKYYGQSLLLSLSTEFEGDVLSQRKFGELVVNNASINTRARLIGETWTAGLLGSIYAYNASRTGQTLGNIRSVYVFLSANAFALCGYNLYRLKSGDGPLKIAFSASPREITLTWLL